MNLFETCNNVSSCNMSPNCLSCEHVIQNLSLNATFDVIVSIWNVSHVKPNHSQRQLDCILWIRCTFSNRESSAGCWCPNLWTMNLTNPAKTFTFMSQIKQKKSNLTLIPINVIAWKGWLLWICECLSCRLRVSFMWGMQWSGWQWWCVECNNENKAQRNKSLS